MKRVKKVEKIAYLCDGFQQFRVGGSICRHADGLRKAFGGTEIRVFNEIAHIPKNR